MKNRHDKQHLVSMIPKLTKPAGAKPSNRIMQSSDKSQDNWALLENRNVVRCNITAPGR
jgi:hypothetical protein